MLQPKQPVILSEAQRAKSKDLTPFAWQAPARKNRVRFLAVLGMTLAALMPFYAALPVRAQVPLSPIQSDLQQEIIGLGQQAASVGLGERSLVDVDARLYVMRIVRGLLTLVGLIFTGMILYAGFLYMTSGGASEKIETARKILAQSAIGVLIIMASYGIVRYVNRSITQAIFRQSFVQIQNCATSNGLATCCREWQSYLNATGEAQTTAYRTWQQCQERENARPREAARRTGGFFNDLYHDNF